MNARMDALEKENLKIVQNKAHNPEQRLICQFCGENFKERWELETHLIIHEEAEKFSCNVCNKHFQTNWRLEKHQQNHYRKNVKVCKYFKKGQFCPFDKVGCKFLHRCSQNEKENEEENISDDESKQENHSKLNKTNMGKKDENVIDHRNDKIDCQGCGEFPVEVQCVECSGRYCTECVLKDHIKNLHYCLNCEDDIE